jgi:hypothetical protein
MGGSYLNRADLQEEIDDCEADFEEISDIINDPDLTPSQKVLEIEDIILEGEEDLEKIS